MSDNTPPDCEHGFNPQYGPVCPFCNDTKPIPREETHDTDQNTKRDR